MRIQSPKSNRRPKPKVARVIVEEVNPVGGFAEFLRHYTVVTLAIGFVVATQVQGLVRQLSAAFIDPTSKLLFGTELSQRTFTLEWHGRAAAFTWGEFIYGVINFLFVLIVIYLLIKLFHLDKLEKPKKK